jgi:uncharacterized membrane protein
MDLVIAFIAVLALVGFAVAFVRAVRAFSPGQYRMSGRAWGDGAQDAAAGDIDSHHHHGGGDLGGGHHVGHFGGDFGGGFGGHHG